MFQNYFKSAWRNLLRNKFFSTINIAGLAIGMASVILIFLWIGNEISYDRFYKDTNRIYLLHIRDKVKGNWIVSDQTPELLSPTLKLDYPGVEKTTRYRNVTFLLTSGDKHLNIQGAFADSDFLSIISFPLLQGNVQHALSGDYDIVLTQKLAKKLFGNQNPMGETVRIDSVDNFRVTGVLKDLPDNTQFNFEYLLPWTYMTKLGWEDKNWTNNFAETFVLLKRGVSQASFDEKIKDIIFQHTQGAVLESRAQVFAQPISRWYLYSEAENGKLVSGRIEMVKLFSIIAAFILLIACINFMNLSTAKSEKRAKEVGIRKVIGAHKSSLIAQFIGESMLLTAIAFIIALLIVQLILPDFNQLVGEQLHMNFRNTAFWLFAVAFIIFTGVLAGSYPAFYLSSFAPVKVLKRNFKKINGLVTSRNILVVSQFTFAIMLIICTLIVVRQIRYAQSREVGYNKNNLVYTFTQGDVTQHYDLIKHDLLSSGAAIAVTRTSSPITRTWSNGWGYLWPGSTASDQKISFLQMATDADFVKTIGVQLLAGRDIDINKYPTDSNAMLLNEAAVEIMHLKNPVGQIIKRVNYHRQWHVVGVMKNFVLQSPFEKVKPMIITGPDYFLQVIHFRLNPAHSSALDLAMAGKIFKKYNPQYPFEYVFVDESYAKKFADSQRIGKLSGLFAVLAIFISCLGLFGLAAFMAENRTKEIGVRKILGASITNITTLLVKGFIRLVLLAFIIASPVAWYVMNKWLNRYSYRIHIHGWEFLLAGLLAIIIALITVSFQAIRAAVANPVESLRTE